MSLQAKVENLIQKALEERQDLFLIKWSVQRANEIEVIIDGDKGVSVEDCIAISRAIEHNLDREEEDFSLQVMSAGISEGLVHPRQYPKNKGRKLKVTTTTGTSIEGELKQVEQDKIKLVWKAREPKPVGKGKITVSKEAVITFEDIKEAKIMITF